MSYDESQWEFAMAAQIEVGSSVLTSWKEIAQYMGKGVRTVQRWEQRHGLPVRRPMGTDHKSTVLALRSDLDGWLSSAWASRAARDTSRAEDHMAKPKFSALKEGLRTTQALCTANQQLMEQFKQALNQLRETCLHLRNCELEQAMEVGLGGSGPFGHESQADRQRIAKQGA
jgi:hypothetical protein